MTLYKVIYEFNKRKGAVEMTARNISELRKMLMDVDLGGYEYYDVYYQNFFHKEDWVYSGTISKTYVGDFPVYLWDNGRTTYQLRDNGDRYR